MSLLFADGGAAFARQWAEAWNRRDVECVLSKFADDAVFMTPYSQALGMPAPIQGKDELRKYWILALSRVRGELRFEVETVLVDERARAITIVYDSHRGHDRTRAVEIMHLDDKMERVVRAEALYGAVFFPE